MRKSLSSLYGPRNLDLNENHLVVSTHVNIDIDYIITWNWLTHVWIYLIINPFLYDLLHHGDVCSTVCPIFPDVFNILCDINLKLGLYIGRWHGESDFITNGTLGPILKLKLDFIFTLMAEWRKINPSNFYIGTLFLRTFLFFYSFSTCSEISIWNVVMYLVYTSNLSFTTIGFIRRTFAYCFWYWLGDVWPSGSQNIGRRNTRSLHRFRSLQQMYYLVVHISIQSVSLIPSIGWPDNGLKL